MPTTPNLRITYPASSDHTRLWEHFATLANELDAIIAAIPRIETDTVTINVSGSHIGSTDVTFDEPYPSTPVIVISGPSDTNYIATANPNNTTPTGGRIAVRHRENTAGTATVTVHYAVIGPRS